MLLTWTWKTDALSMLSLISCFKELYICRYYNFRAKPSDETKKGEKGVKSSHGKSHNDKPARERRRPQTVQSHSIFEQGPGEIKSSTGYFTHHGLIDRLIDWLIDWLTNWLIDWLIDWYIEWLVGWLVGWLIDWLTVWLIGWWMDGLRWWIVHLICLYCNLVIIANVAKPTYTYHINMIYHVNIITVITDALEKNIT